MSEDVVCIDCENERKRGDEQFDRAETCQKEVDRIGDIYDLKCDMLRETLLTNARLRMLLHNKGIVHDD